MFVVRYVVTYKNRRGDRTLADPRQGRFTYATKAEAEARAEAITANNSDSRIADVFGPQSIGTFRADPVDCYPGHFDPKTCWFEE